MEEARISIRQRPSVSIIVYGAPTAMLLVLVFPNHADGVSSVGLDLLAFEGFLLLVSCAPLFSLVKEATIYPDRLVVRYFTARRKVIPWSTVNSTGIFSVKRGSGAKRMVRIVKRSGRSIVVTDLVEGFEPFVGALTTMPGLRQRNEPNRIDRLWGATEAN